MAAFGIDAGLLGIAVFHQEVDIVHRRLIVELAVDAQQRCRRPVQQPLLFERQRGRNPEKFLKALHAHRPAAGLEQADRPEDRDGCPFRQRRQQPLFLKAVMHVAAVEHRAFHTLRFDERELRGPIPAVAPAPYAEAGGVDVVALQQMIDQRGKRALGVGLGVEHRALAGAGHVDRKAREAGLVQPRVRALPVFFPAVDAAPMHDDRGFPGTGRDLQIADELFAFERHLDDLERRVEILRRLPEIAQRVLVGLLRAGRGRAGVARDAEIIECEHVKAAKLFSVASALRERIGLPLIAGPELAPLARPLVAVEARQRPRDPCGILRLDVVQRVHVAAAPDDFGFHFLQWAYLDLGIYHYCHTITPPVDPTLDS